MTDDLEAALAARLHAALDELRGAGVSSPAWRGLCDDGAEWRP